MNHPQKKIAVDVEVSEIKLVPGQAVTIFCVPYSHLPYAKQSEEIEQIEIRMIPHTNKIEIFTLKTKEVNSFADWYPVLIKKGI